MKNDDQYLRFVKWSDEDGLYVGFCPDLFPWGGVCHSDSQEDCYRILCELVREEVGDLVAAARPLPIPCVRVMKDAVPA